MANIKSSRWSRKMKANRSKILLGIALAIGAAIYFSAITPYIGDGYDDSVYVGLAKSIAEGRGYVQALVPSAPPASKYPPGWALILSLVWLIWDDFPANIVVFKLVSTIFTLGLATLVFNWLRWRGESAVKSLLIASLTLFHPYVLQFGTSVFSAMPFAAAVVLSLWMVERYDRLPRAGWRDALLPSLAVALSLYLRMFGLSIVAATIFYLIFRENKRAEGFRFAALTLLWITPWFIYLLSVPQGVNGYGQELFLKSIEQRELGVITALDLIVRVLGNLQSILLAGLPGMIMPSQVPLTYVNVADALQIGAPITGVDYGLATLLMTAILVPILLRRSLLDWFIALYLGMVLIWPWEPTRFLVPLVPLLYLYLFSFLEKIGSGISKRNEKTGVYLRIASISAVGLFIFLNIVHQINFSIQTQRAATPVGWESRYRLFEWLEENTAEDAVLASLNDYQLYLYTDRQTVRTFDSTEALERYGVDYIILIPYGGVMLDEDLSRKHFSPLYEANADLFSLVYADENAGIEILEIQESGLSND